MKNNFSENGRKNTKIWKFFYLIFHFFQPVLLEKITQKVLNANLKNFKLTN
jgi:hypothetical protein